MVVYRITLARFSHTLQASGNAARWNSKDVQVIYTASSRALACLENIVHRSAMGLHDLFRTLVIDIPDDIATNVINRADLIPGWYEFANYPTTQAMGDAWIAANTSAVLKLPSAIIPEESNYLLNPAHADYKRIRLIQTEPFTFDERIKK